MDENPPREGPVRYAGHVWPLLEAVKGASVDPKSLARVSAALGALDDAPEQPRYRERDRPVTVLDAMPDMPALLGYPLFDV